MKLKTTAFLLLLLAHSFSSAHAEPQGRPRDWIALEVNGKIVTASEVRSYIDSVVLSSDLHRMLFEEAGRDYAVYEQKKNAIIDELFVSTLDRISVTRVLQAKATEGTDRRFFTITKKQVRDSLQEGVRKALGKFQTTGASLEDSRDAFVADLKRNGLPYNGFASSSEIFDAWKNRLATRLREDYRQQEASRFLCSKTDCRKLKPIEAYRNARETLESGVGIVLRPTPESEFRAKEVFDRLASLDRAELNSANSPNFLNEIKNFFYLGKIVNDKIELLHINDWNLTGPIGSAMGMPRTDDFGRTSGFVLTLNRTGEKGSLSVQYENWLFTERLPDIGRMRRQILEEENTLRVVSRHFIDEKGSKWVLIGVSGTYRSQKEGLGALIQDYFHSLSGNRHYQDVERNGSDLFFNGLFGVGGKYSIIDKPYMDLVVSGESFVSPAVGRFSQSNVTVKPSMDLSFYAQDKSLPTFRIGLFSEVRTRINGDIETTIGGKITAGVIIKKIQIGQ